MKNIIVKSQAEFDAIPIDYVGRVYVEFGTPYNRAIINRRFKYSVVARKNSSVEAWGNSSVVARENSSVEARENSSVEAWGNSSVVAWGNSSVEAWGNSSVVARENSSVEARGNSSVVAMGNSQVLQNSAETKIEVSGNARIVYNPTNIAEYLKHYGLTATRGKVKLYKAVHKRDGKYLAQYDNTEYVIGKTVKADNLTEDVDIECGHGIHVAYRQWCVDFGKDWDDLSIIEVECSVKSIVVPKYSNGKVRTDKVKVLREVPLEECGLLGKMTAKRRGAK